MRIQGKIMLYGNNIDTDVIIPARYLNTSDPKELAAHCMEDLDKTFASRVKPGDILMAGTNFGCGSSREHAPMAIKASGIACVVAIDFARIFYRNAINIGLPILECADAVKECREGDQLDIDFNKGTIYNVTQGKTYQTFPFPPFLQNIIQAGGLMQAAKKTKPEGRV